jgi:hypothetical protein
MLDFISSEKFAKNLKRSQNVTFSTKLQQTGKTYFLKRLLLREKNSSGPVLSDSEEESNPPKKEINTEVR